MTQVSTDQTALLLSGIALAIAILSAAFTGWEAITAHLARTQPRKAHWAIDYTEVDRMAANAWRILNAGGSLGTDVKLQVTHLRFGERDEKKGHFTAVGVVQPNGRAALVGSERHGDPRKMILRNDDGKYEEVPAGTDGAQYLMGQGARITWRDHRGKNRVAKIPIR